MDSKKRSQFQASLFRTLSQGHVSSQALIAELDDPIKIFLVRFFDTNRQSKSTHPVWNNVFHEIETNTIYASIIPRQIRTGFVQ